MILYHDMHGIACYFPHCYCMIDILAIDCLNSLYSFLYTVQ